MKQNIVRDLTTDEIRERLVEERTNYTRIKMNHTVSPVENPMKIKSARKVIARLNTELKKRTSNQQTA